MHDFLFYLFSAITVLAGLMVVMNRNAVNAAMFMILAFLATAALFVMLEAYFLAILQVLVYAGAVMVLFLFIVMLLDVEGSEKTRPDMPSLAISIVGLLILIAGVQYYFFGASELQTMELLPVAESAKDAGKHVMAYTSSAKSFGYGLFTKYMLPFQVVGFLLLMAMMGVVLISRNLGQKKEKEI